ncbi:MAG: aldo/keto reductase [Bryobacteraceae bacterium]
MGFCVGFTPDPTVIARAIDLGINYFDTARIYGQGNSERLLAEAIRGKRDRVILGSKTASRTKEEALRDIDTSLQVLGTDHLDVWFLHAKDTPGGDQR